MHGILLLNRLNLYNSDNSNGTHEDGKSNIAYDC